MNRRNPHHTAWTVVMACSLALTAFAAEPAQRDTTLPVPVTLDTGSPISLESFGADS